MSTGRPTGRPPKTPDARSELRGRGQSQVVHVAPAASEHARLVAGMRSGDLVDALTTAAEDAAWLRLADLPALILAREIAAALGGARMAEPPTEDATDEVGTIPAFADAGGAGVATPKRARGPAPLRDLGPMLVGLLADLGMTPQARVRLSITLVEEPEPVMPAPTRMPRTAR